MACGLVYYSHHQSEFRYRYFLSFVLSFKYTLDGKMHNLDSKYLKTQQANLYTNIYVLLTFDRLHSIRWHVLTVHMYVYVYESKHSNKSVCTLTYIHTAIGCWDMHSSICTTAKRYCCEWNTQTKTPQLDIPAVITEKVLLVVLSCLWGKAMIIYAPNRRCSPLLWHCNIGFKWALTHRNSSDISSRPAHNWSQP